MSGKSSESFLEQLSVGIVQTTLDHRHAWNPMTSSSPRIEISEDNRSWHEIRRAMRSFADHDEKPRVVLLPELSLPRTRLLDFERMVCAMNVIAIVGVDYKLNQTSKVARNEGLVIVPRNFWKRRPSLFGTQIWFGKTTPAPAEASGLKKYTPPWGFEGDDNVYVFDAGPLGKFGVSICYDFMDIERALLYRGRIHHLIVLAYNQDLKMFESLAVSLSRTVFCNVIICNTGHYGGSLVVTPFYEAHKRVGYSIGGGELYSQQCVQLPVRGLDAAMHGADLKNPDPTYKNPPPGFQPI
jgi:hypothetical protein